MKRLSLLLALCCLSVASLLAQRTIRGAVTGEDGEPLIGASVLVKGTTSGTVTDLDGRYELRVPEGDNVLVFSYTGYTAQEIPLGASDVVDVTLSEGVTLTTAVITALGIRREKKALSYSVEEVDGSALEQSKETNLVNALAGKVSGVLTTSSSGQAGASARIVIRGNSSFLGNNQPLFVIDGIPVDNSQIFGGGQTNSNGTGTGDSPLFFGGTTNRVVDIDPSNVASLSILKGASATALYGSRAANGVVLITTKSGQKGARPTIQFSSNYGLNEARLPPLQTTYAQGNNGIFSNGNLPGQATSLAWGPRIDTLRLDAQGNFDPNGTPAQVYNNADDFFRTGSNFDNSLSISGGSEQGTYYVSYANRIEKGIIINNDMDRHSLLAKFSTDLAQRLSVAASFTYTNTDLVTATEGNGLQSYMWTVYGAPPSYNLRGANNQDYLNPDGTQRLYRTNRNNPYFVVDNNQLQSNVNRFLPTLSVTYKLLPNLSLINRAGADIYTDRRLYREVIGTLGTYPSGRVYEDDINYKQLNNDLLLQYTSQFGSFDIDGIIGHQINVLQTDRLYTQGVNLTVPNFFDLSNASTISALQNNNERRLIGVYGQATLGFNNYLYLTMTARNDWSSTLPAGNRSYFYPSISGSFVLTDAIASLQNDPVLSFIKFRLGYAEVGNDAPVYGTQTDLYTQSTVGDGQRGQILFPYDGQNSFALSNVIGNPDLRPERTKEVEAGIETRFFNNRIRFEGSYYNRLSKDQIFQAPVAGSSGAISQVVNAGSMRNRGFEVLLELTPLQFGSFRWEVGGTFTRNENIVEELTEGVENIRLGGFTNPGIYIIRNLGYGVIWGSQYERDDQGRVLINSDPNSAGYGLPLRTATSLGAVGNTMPDWFAGIRSTLSFGNERFGNLSVYGLLDIRQGGDILNLDNFYLNFYGVTEQSAKRTGEETFVYPNGVLADGSTNDIEVPYTQNYWQNFFGRADEDLVEDGSFIRLREVTLSYSLPTSLLRSTFIQNMRLSVTGRNLWLHAPNFTGSDPEASIYGSANGQGFYNFITPGTKGYNVALNVTF